MAKRGNAFLLNTAKDTRVLVPYGKYAGLWTYHKATKTCRWNFTFAADLADVKAKAYGPSGKSRTFPLPDMVYHWLGSGHPGKLHAANRKQLGWAVTKWAAFNATRLRPIADIVSRFNDAGAFSGMYSHVGLRYALAFATPHTLRAFADSKDDFAVKVDFLGRSGNFLRHLSPARRQRFVVRCLQGGSALAVRKAFRRADNELISDVFASGTWTCEPDLAHVFLASAEKNQKLGQFESLLHMARSGSLRKISRLKIHQVNEADHGGPNT